MTQATAVEIHFHDCSLVVSPSLKEINRRKSARKISSKVTAALDQPREHMVTDVIVDLGQVTWISSAGLNELIRLRAQSRASGIHLRLRSLNEAVRDVFRITRLERIFEFDVNPENESTSVASAIESDHDHSVQVSV
ncbi:STAS domain-containing protein [Stieleria sp. ICT_E10.1]|uniref:STAS domain-containing protein n=1 Tax=Stieleria sedimenti TaxID=2976331 RepID=UPI0021805BA7|nr:STAS domain-containing protein [Stieleria sedimenti]MCS7468239.1 STAS domain-containing protein [Stieleria sedimenti]